MLHGAGKEAQRWQGSLAKRVHSNRDSIVFWGVMLLAGVAIGANASEQSTTARPTANGGSASASSPRADGVAVVLPYCDGSLETANRHFELYRRITAPQVRGRR